MSEARKILQSKLAQKLNLPKPVPGTLGNSDGDIAVIGSSNMVYVTTQSGVLKVYNFRVPLQHGLPVLIGYDPLQPQWLQILDILYADLTNSGDDLGAVPNHAYYHGYMQRDMVEVDLRQFLPFRPWVTDPASFNIVINEGFVRLLGVWTYIESTTVDLSSYALNDPTDFQYLLVTLSTSGTYVVTAGTVTDDTIDFTDIPEPPANTQMVICAVRLYGSQPAIEITYQDTDVVDLRFPSAIETGTLDHTDLLNIGTNTHAQIDTHMADSALHEATGFLDTPGVTLSFSNATRTLTITPTGANFSFYYNGTKYTKTGAQTKQISVTTGMHYIYYDSAGALQESTSPWDIQNTVQVATVYWNGSDNLLGNELHGLEMDKKTHEYLHETVGTRYAMGLAGTITNTGTTIGLGEWYDEDIEHATTGDTTTVKVLYIEGGVWKWTAAQAKCFHEVSNILQYNNSGALADVDNSKFTAYFIYATNIPGSYFISIMGQGQYNTLALAKTGAVPESLVFGTMPAAEMKLLYRVIIQRSGTSESIADVTDYRAISPVPTSGYVATDHGSLTGLTDLDHPASAIHTDTTNFAGQLSASDDTVQKALDTLDNLVIAGDAEDITVDATGFTGNLSPTDTDVQTALETIDAMVVEAGEGGGITLDQLHEHAYNEDHTGECDGSEDTFYTANEFVAETVQVFLEGALLRLNVDYTESVFQDYITLTTPPSDGDVLILHYMVA